MKRLVLLLLTSLAVLVSTGTRPLEAAEKDKVRVLLTCGGHGFGQGPFFAMFDAMPDVEYTKAEMPKDAGLLKPGLEKDYDVIVMYDMVRKISPEQQKAFVELLNRGIGLVSLHHNIAAHRDWDEFRKIIGGKYILSSCVIDGPCVIDGRKYPKSTYDHGQDINVMVVDKDHPITRGLKDFQIHDEAYKGYYTSPDVKVLLKTDHPKNNPELAWVNQYGNSRVFYFMLGHDRHAWQNPSYPKILLGGIHWASGH